MSRLPEGLARGEPAAFLNLGLLSLMVTPMARVAASVTAFALARDRVFCALTTAVFCFFCLALFWVWGNVGDGIIVTDNLTKVYGKGIRAVDGISFSVFPGEIFGLLGPNGAGKSTTMGVLTTLLRPTSGRAWVCGYEVSTSSLEVRRQIGYVLQDIAVDDNLTGWDNLYLQGRLYHLGSKELARRIGEVLEMVDLVERAHDLVETYSGGMRKRLDLACGLLHRPKVLFLDEPTLGLDIQTRHRIWEYIKRLRQEMGLTVFLSTHYMEEADLLCDRVAIIDQGRICALGSPAELKQTIMGDIITLVLDGDVEAKRVELVALLERLPLVMKVNAGAGGSFSLVVRSGEKAIPAVIAALNDFGAAVNSLSLKRPTLEDVFLHYTGRELREEGGGESFRRTARALRRARR